MSVKKSNAILAIILSLSFAGIYTYTAPNASGSVTPKMVRMQQKNQNKPKLVKKVRKQSKNKKSKTNWFRDGLNNNELKARHKVAYLESRYQWKVTNGKCWGRFQLLPSYLGYTHGHVNLNKKNQVKVADKYVHDRYGTWQKALQFHLAHNWY